jgi:large subunit ribosomal protein L15
MQFHELKNTVNDKKKKRVGRGRSSGKGKTAGRGTKGQKSRSGHRKLPSYFEGGQMPLVQRLPKLRGFKKSPKIKWETINVEKLNNFVSNSEINRKLLLEKKLIKYPGSLVKILGDGDLNKKLSVEANAFSAGAADKIKKAGGKVIIEQKTSKKDSKDTRPRKETKK